MVELTGPVVTSLSAVFAVDWYLESEEALSLEPLPYDDALTDDSNFLQLIPSGPGYTTEPNLRMFNSLVHHANGRNHLTGPTNAKILSPGIGLRIYLYSKLRSSTSTVSGTPAGQTSAHSP